MSWLTAGSIGLAAGIAIPASRAHGLIDTLKRNGIAAGRLDRNDSDPPPCFLKLSGLGDKIL